MTELQRFNWWTAYFFGKNDVLPFTKAPYVRMVAAMETTLLDREQQTLSLDGQTADLAKIAEKPIEIPIRKPFVIEMPAGAISDKGMQEIRYYMIGHNLGVLPDDFEPIWTTKRGTLPKRVTSWCYKERSIKLTPEHVSQIGNIGKKHTLQSTKYILDFTDKINWRSGAFGDEGSCLWGGDRRGALQMINDNGYAVRAYRGELGNLTGYARAWLAPIMRRKQFIVFNGYGESSLTFSRLLSYHWERTYKSISLTNNGEEDGTLYINCDGNLIGHWKDIKDVTSWDLGWEEVKEIMSRCNNCGDRVYDDDLVTTVEGDVFCRQCAHYCDGCEVYFTNELRYNSELEINECYSCRVARREREAEELAEKESEVAI